MTVRQKRRQMPGEDLIGMCKPENQKIVRPDLRIPSEAAAMSMMKPRSLEGAPWSLASVVIAAGPDEVVALIVFGYGPKADYSNRYVAATTALSARRTVLNARTIPAK